MMHIYTHEMTHPSCNDTHTQPTRITSHTILHNLMCDDDNLPPSKFQKPVNTQKERNKRRCKRLGKKKRTNLSDEIHKRAAEGGKMREQILKTKAENEIAIKERHEQQLQKREELREKINNQLTAHVEPVKMAVPSELAELRHKTKAGRYKDFDTRETVSD